MIRERITRILTRISDTVIHGRNKAMIILGTDRDVEEDSGYGDGGENDIDSAVIDMVVGFGPEQTNPDHVNDKSRIYIAEKTDPDQRFAISVGSEVTEAPAIIQISDNIYLKARNKIKILNGNISIIIDENGEINIEASSKATIKVGSSKIVISDGGIELDSGQGISGRVITDLDTPVHIDPVTGATVIANFQTPPASPVKNQKVIIK